MDEQEFIQNKKQKLDSDEKAEKIPAQTLVLLQVINKLLYFI